MIRRAPAAKLPRNMVTMPLMTNTTAMIHKTNSMPMGLPTRLRRQTVTQLSIVSDE